MNEKIFRRNLETILKTIYQIDAEVKEYLNNTKSYTKASEKEIKAYTLNTREAGNIYKQKQ